MRSAIGDSSVLLWMAAALVTFLAARAFIEYLRRLVHMGPLRLWRELLLCAAALSAGLWGATVLDISAQGLAFEIGFHPLKVFGALAAAWLVVGVIVTLFSIRPRWYTQLAASAVLALAALGLQMSVVWSMGAEPGLLWRREPLLFAALVSLVGFTVSMRMVASARRGSKADRSTRRLLAALVLGACSLAAQELVLASSGLDRQVVSAHARFLPEVAIMLVAGATVPTALVLMLVDQHAQQRARASERARRKRPHQDYPADGEDETRFSDSMLATGVAETPASGRR